MSDDQQIREKLAKIKALFAGATTPGERQAAQVAIDRIQQRIDGVPPPGLSSDNEIFRSATIRIAGRVIAGGSRLRSWAGGSYARKTTVPCRLKSTLKMRNGDLRPGADDCG